MATKKEKNEMVDTVVGVDGTVVQVHKARAMSYTERKAFRAAGLDPAFIPNEKRDDKQFVAEVSERMIDWMLDEIYGGKESKWYENVGYDVLSELAKNTYALTYGGVVQEKN